MEIKKINNVSCGLLVCLLILVSCANGEEPKNPNEGLVDIEFRLPMDGFEANTRYDNPYRDFARAILLPSHRRFVGLVGGLHRRGSRVRIMDNWREMV